MSPMQDAHALVIGIANYQYINKLPREVLNDAQDIHDLLTNPQYCGYPEDNVRLLLDEQATQSAIRRELSDLAERSSPESTAFIYISSHGGRILAGPNEGEYLLPVGVEVEYDDEGNIVLEADGQPLLAADTAISSSDPSLTANVTDTTTIGFAPGALELDRQGKAKIREILGTRSLREQLLAVRRCLADLVAWHTAHAAAAKTGRLPPDWLESLSAQAQRMLDRWDQHMVEMKAHVQN